MASPTSAIDDLLGLLTPDEQAVVRAVVLKNDKAKQALEEGLAMRKEYLGDDTVDDAAAAAAKATADAKAAADAVEAARVAAAARAAAGNGNGSADLAAITVQLTALSGKLDTQIADLKKNFVSVDKLPEYRGELLTQTIRLSHEVSRLENQHKSEFGEDLNLDELNTYVEEQKKAGVNFPSITKAYEAKMSEKRIAKKIADGIAEGLKNKKSADGATAASGGSGSTALSPGQELLRKAKGEGGSQDHILSMADKLRQIREARESREGGVAEAS